MGMDTLGRLTRHTTATLLAAGMLAGGLLATTPAVADSVIAADTTAQNVSAYGTTSAWSRQATDGTYRLVVMGASGVPADAPVRGSRFPLDPDVGPTAKNGRYIVYSRCTRAGGRGCDVYGYDVRSRKERRIAGVSTRERSERAPSYFKGALAFVRNGSQHGLYVARRGQRPRRIADIDASETDLSATHVISGNETVVLSRLDGSRARDLGESYFGEAAYSLAQGPVLARGRAYWIAGGGEYTESAERFGVTVLSVSTLDAASPIERSMRYFTDAAMSAIALGPSGTPELYAGAAGVSRIAPLLAFAP